MTYFSNRRSNILKYMENFSPASVLEIGCGEGDFLFLLKNTYGCTTTGIEINKQASFVASSKADYIINDDIIQLLKSDFSFKSYDLIVLNDVLEHLLFPEVMLSELIDKCQKGTKFIVSIPNFLFIDNISKIVLLRDFRYEESGILDKTHYRFFTRISIVRFFKQFNICSFSIGPLNQVSTIKWRLLNFLLLGMLNDFLVYQYIVKFSK